MSCNGCRVLRKGCSESCMLRPCLQWIKSPEAQGHATVFVAKFFGRAGLMNFISSVPEPQRPAIFQSLLFEACGRTVNPVNGAVGLLWTGNWQICQKAVETVLRGGTLQPIADLPEHPSGTSEIYSREGRASNSNSRNRTATMVIGDALVKPSDLDISLSPTFVRRRLGSPEEEELSVSTSSGIGDIGKPMLLNLFTRRSKGPNGLFFGLQIKD